MLPADALSKCFGGTGASLSFISGISTGVSLSTEDETDSSGVSQDKLLSSFCKIIQIKKSNNHK